MAMYEHKCWQATCDVCGDPYDNGDCIQECGTETLLGFRLLHAGWRMDVRDGMLFCPDCAHAAAKENVAAEEAEREAQEQVAHD